MKRRVLIKQAGAALAAGALPLMHSTASAAGVTANQVTLGCSIALSGILADAGQGHLVGLKAALGAANQTGGVHGRTVELTVVDDGYDGKRAAANVGKMIESDNVLGLVSLMGTPCTAAALPLIAKGQVPTVGAVTGADSLRKAGDQNMYFVRPGYGQEAKRLAQQIGSFGLKNVAVVYLDNVFGTEVAKVIEAELKAGNTPFAGAVPLPADGKGGAAVASAVAQLKPGAVIMATTGTATTDFVLPFRALMADVPLSGLSVSVISSERTKIGAHSRGLALVTVFPDISNPKYTVSRVFKDAMDRAGVKDFNPTTFEGWVNGQLMIEGLKGAGRELTRDSLRKALAGVKRLSLGDYNLGFSEQAPYVASRFMELAVFGPDFRRVG